MTPAQQEEITAIMQVLKESIEPFPMTMVYQDDNGDTKVQGSVRIIAERLYLRGIRRVDG